MSAQIPPPPGSLLSSHLLWLVSPCTPGACWACHNVCQTRGYERIKDSRQSSSTPSASSRGLQTQQTSNQSLLVEEWVSCLIRSMKSTYGLAETGLLKRRKSWLEVSDISDGTAVIRKKKQMKFPDFSFSSQCRRLNNPLQLRQTQNPYPQH